MKSFNLSLKIILLVFLVVVFAFRFVNIANAKLVTNIDKLASEFDKMFGGDFSEVINNISTEANSGGNNAAGGEVVNGKAVASTSVKTIINGRVVEDYSIKKEAADGQVEVNIKSEINTDNNKAVVETTTVVNGEESKRKSEINLDEKAAAQTEPENAYLKDTADQNNTEIKSAQNSCGLSPEAGCLGTGTGEKTEVEEKAGINILALAWKGFLDLLVGGVIKLAGVFR